MSNACPNQEVLLGLIADTLDRVDAQSIFTHLLTCQSCRALTLEWVDDESLWETLLEHPDEACRRDLIERNLDDRQAFIVETHVRWCASCERHEWGIRKETARDLFQKSRDRRKRSLGH